LNNIKPMPLPQMAGAIASTHNATGAIIITVDKEGVHAGGEGLTPQQIQDALCTVIGHNLNFPPSK